MEKIMTAIPTKWLIIVGAVTLAVVCWIVRSIIAKALDEQFDKIKKDNSEGRNEREYDNYLLLRGMQVISDCEHELIYCVMNGTHNGGLERANKELDEFRQLSNDNLVKKASKWNIKIER